MTRAVVVVLAAAVATFCIVQDRVTAAGARRYVQLHRQAMAGGSPAPTVDDVMQPAIRRSVGAGLLSGGAVAGAGLVIAAAARRRIRGE